MKNKELFFLAYDDINYYKRQNKNTIISFTFSMTLLIIILFLGLSFYGGVMSNVNKYKAISSVKIESNRAENLNEVLDLFHQEDIDEMIYYQFSAVSYYRDKTSFSSPEIIYYPTISINGKIIKYEEAKSDKFEIYNENQIISAEEEFMKKKYQTGVLAAGTMLSGNDNEIIVSSKFVDDIGYQYDEIIGKTISYKLIQPKTKYSNETEEVIVFTNLTIVGVFDERLYISPSRGEDTYYAPTFWCNEKTSLTFASYQEKFCASIISFKSFKACYSYLASIKNKFAQMVKNNEYLNYETNMVLNDYDNFKPLFNFLVQVFSIFTLVILFATIINLYITISYSYFKKRKYLAMCRAIGMEDYDVKRLFFFETLIVLLKSLLITIILSMVLCLLGMILINNSLLDVVSMSTIMIKLSYIYYVPIVILIIVFVGLVSLLISRLVYSLNKKEEIIKELNG